MNEQEKRKKEAEARAKGEKFEPQDTTTAEDREVENVMAATSFMGGVGAFFGGLLGRKKTKEDVDADNDADALDALAGGAIAAAALGALANQEHDSGGDDLRND